MMAVMEEALESRTPFWKNHFLWFFLIGAATLTLMRPFLRHEPPPPPVLFTLPAFELIDQDGASFSGERLRDSVWVVDFIFTRCPSICPLLTRSMAHLQGRYGRAAVDGVRLLSISVDPEYDTPERLRAYRELHEGDPARWSFLTGEPDAVRTLLVDGFKAAMGEPQESDGLMDISHSGKFFLVDGDGGVRGFYDSDEMGLDEVFHRSQHVLKEQKGR